MYALTIDVDPEHAAASYRLGECLCSLGRNEDALPFLQKCIDLCYGNFDRRQLMTMANAKLAGILP
jgi:tetratricopeptide (TPR) repeat protein